MGGPPGDRLTGVDLPRMITGARCRDAGAKPRRVTGSLRHPHVGSSLCAVRYIASGVSGGGSGSLRRACVYEPVDARVPAMHQRIARSVVNRQPRSLPAEPDEHPRDRSRMDRLLHRIAKAASVRDSGENWSGTAHRDSPSSFCTRFQIRLFGTSVVRTPSMAQDDTGLLGSIVGRDDPRHTSALARLTDAQDD
jgi:hypothetical protein